mmetsp:Transcript_21069/g.48729  ORF Transcript_21069/g.48729 Transcript_21069/m.48729 type:complete len:694 (-) Transcript_21069:385-2466(-)
MLAMYRGTAVAVKKVLPSSAEIAEDIPKSLLRPEELEPTATSPMHGLERSQSFGSKTLFNNMGTSTPPKNSSLSRSSSSLTADSVRKLVQGSIKFDSKIDTDIINKTSSGGGLNSLGLGHSSMGRFKKTGHETGLMSSAFNSMATWARDLSDWQVWLIRMTLGEQFLENQRTQRLLRDFIDEMRVISKLRHPCITTVMGAIIVKNQPMLVMEHMRLGSLRDVLDNQSVDLRRDLLMNVLKDITQGMMFLHTADPPIVHGDVKAGNVLISEGFQAKVSDFGLSQKKKMGSVGTPYFMAPELLNGAISTSNSDVYAFAIMLVEVFSRNEPYAGQDTETVLSAVADLKSNEDKRPDMPSGISAEVEVLIKECWAKNPTRRPTFLEIDRRIKSISEVQLTSDALKKFEEKNKNKPSTPEDVLFNIFPKHVAECLVEGKKIEPEKKPMLTIFFSDVVNFTSISSKIGPLKVTNLLDRMYTRFDRCAEKYKVFKVDTIGDAYMAVTNLVVQQDSDHAARMAGFAIEVSQVAKEVLIDEDDPDKGTLCVRCGFHSGPVVAAVVGVRCPRYTLFGDAVNTASRMESTSIDGRIQCSLKAAMLVRSQAPSVLLQKRGEVMIKGKGVMTTYLVNGEPGLFKTDVSEIGSRQDISGEGVDETWENQDSEDEKQSENSEMSTTVQDSRGGMMKQSSSPPNNNRSN